MRNYTLLLLSIFGIYFLTSTSTYALHLHAPSPETKSASADIVISDANGVEWSITRGIFKALDALFDASGNKAIPLEKHVSRRDLNRLISYHDQENITECSMDLLSEDIHRAELLDAPRIVKRNVLQHYFAVTKFMAQTIKSENILEALPKSAQPDYKHFKKLWPQYANSIANRLIEDPTLFKDCFKEDTLRLNNLELDTLEGLPQLFDCLTLSPTSIATLDVRYNNLTKLCIGTLQQQYPSLTTIKTQDNDITSLDTTNIDLKRGLKVHSGNNQLSSKQIESFMRLQPSFLQKMTPYLNRIKLATRQEKYFTGLVAVFDILCLILLGNLLYQNIRPYASVAFVSFACICINICFFMNSDYYYKKNIDPHKEPHFDKYRSYKKIQIITATDHEDSSA